MTALAIFTVTYIGVALGRIPGLVIDRVGIALLGAIAMVVFGVVTPTEAVQSIDLPTILLLYALMVVSAQLRLGGFYTWAASRIIFLLRRPRWFLLTSMVMSALLSSILANDIVCFAFTPVLAISVLHANLNPLPFLIGLAVSSNIGSAATIIGNPQNMLIGQVGKLDFAEFLLWCGPPAVIALMGSYLVILLIYRKKFHRQGSFQAAEPPEKMPAFNRWQTIKGITVTGILMVLFFTPVPREISAVGIAGILLCSRRMKTRDILGLVDWHLITLFCALFVVIHAISLGNYPHLVVTYLAEMGIDLHNLLMLTGISTVLSNVFSNVPATMLLVRFLDAANPAQWFTLAVSSTFAGNLIIIGSIANLIVIEQAAIHGIKITFRQHAAVGLPVTLVSLGVLIIWMYI
ncbi:MAG: anion transporter [Desulfobacterales bacterium]|nr:anion transporter [Desulfobacterales bacterium]